MKTLKEKDRVLKFETWLKQFCKTEYEKKCFEDWKQEIKEETQHKLLKKTKEAVLEFQKYLSEEEAKLGFKKETYLHILFEFNKIFGDFKNE